MIGFYALTVLILVFECLHFSPSFAHSNYIHMTSIGFLLVILTTISFSNHIYNLKNTEILDFYKYFIPIIPIFLPILGFTFIQYSMQKHKKNYGLEDDALYKGRSEKSKYIGLNIFYFVMTIIYILYLYQVTTHENGLEYRTIITYSIGLFILLEIIVYFMWDYYHKLLKQKADG
jgi:hypothetical protein